MADRGEVDNLMPPCRDHHRDDRPTPREHGVDSLRRIEQSTWSASACSPGWQEDAATVVIRAIGGIRDAPVDVRREAVLAAVVADGRFAASRWRWPARISRSTRVSCRRGWARLPGGRRTHHRGTCRPGPRGREADPPPRRFRAHAHPVPGGPRPPPRRHDPDRPAPVGDATARETPGGASTQTSGPWSSTCGTSLARPCHACRHRCVDHRADRDHVTAAAATGPRCTKSRREGFRKVVTSSPPEPRRPLRRRVPPAPAASRLTLCDANCRPHAAVPAAGAVQLGRAPCGTPSPCRGCTIVTSKAVASRSTSSTISDVGGVAQSPRCGR